MSERQKHGFEFQEQYISSNNLKPDESYTGEWDAYTQNGIPVQIKTRKKNGELDLGDLKRNLNKSQDFLLVVGDYSENSNGKNFDTPKCYYVNKNNWKKQFNCSCLEEMYNFLDEITNDYSDDQKWKEGTKEFKKITEANAVPRFKRDHKKQKRIQAAVSKKNLMNFYNSFQEVKISNY
jgi:hypothetical protein